MDRAWFEDELAQRSYSWLVTGAAGFIGSHLVSKLLELGQIVTGLDNFSTGRLSNLREVERLVGPEAWRRFCLVEADIRDLKACTAATAGHDFVLHEAALASVPLSVSDPATTHEVNVTGFMNLLLAARSCRVKRVVYASSCAVYGDSAQLPLSETATFKPLSPYAASKACNELYAQSFSRTFSLSTVGLRYFNVYGERQDPNGAYAAVIPRWIRAMIDGDNVLVNGDGLNTRDFIYVGTVVDANIAAALLPDDDLNFDVLNVASGKTISLNELVEILARATEERADIHPVKLRHGSARPSDIRHSAAKIERFTERLRLTPQCIQTSIGRAIDWYSSQNSL